MLDEAEFLSDAESKRWQRCHAEQRLTFLQSEAALYKALDRDREAGDNGNDDPGPDSGGMATMIRVLTVGAGLGRITIGRRRPQRLSAPAQRGIRRHRARARRQAQTLRRPSAVLEATALGGAAALTRNLSPRERMSEGQVRVLGTLSQGERDFYRANPEMRRRLRRK
jgi:hypothetical protein